MEEKRWVVVEGLRGDGVIWIEDSVTGDTVCDLYFKKDFQKQALMTEYYTFDNAKEHALLIASAPQQQALIDELTKCLRYAFRRCKAIKEDVDMQYIADMITKAERK